MVVKMNFQYTDPLYKMFLKKNDEEFEQDINDATFDLVGPDRWHEGKIYTAIIDKKYTPVYYQHDPDEVEILVKCDSMKLHYTVSIYGWRAK